MNGVSVQEIHNAIESVEYQFAKLNDRTIKWAAVRAKEMVRDKERGG